MKIYLTQTSDISSVFTSKDVISAYISQKKENGYIVNIDGTVVFAHCSLDLDIGDFLKLKIVESSTSQIVFKVVQHEIKQPQKPLMTLDIPHTPEAQSAVNLLSKLNLPIEKERVTFIIDLLNQLIDEEKPKPSLLSMKELSFQAQKSSFREALTRYISSGPTVFDDQLMELLQESTALEDKAFTLNKVLMHKQSKAAVVKEYFALKALTLLHDKGSGSNISFYALPIPIYHNTYLKISKDSSADDTQHPVNLSFIINTKNLGAVLIDLLYVNGKVKASSTFEEKKAMDVVKLFLDMNKNLHSLIRTMELKVGKVSMKDFFFGEIKERPITTGINLRV
jgi:hypothetical protein